MDTIRNLIPKDNNYPNAPNIIFTLAKKVSFKNSFGLKELINETCKVIRAANNNAKSKSDPNKISQSLFALSFEKTISSDDELILVLESYVDEIKKHFTFEGLSFNATHALEHYLCNEIKKIVKNYSKKFKQYVSVKENKDITLINTLQKYRYVYAYQIIASTISIAIGEKLNKLINETINKCNEKTEELIKKCQRKWN